MKGDEQRNERNERKQRWIGMMNERREIKRKRAYDVSEERDEWRYEWRERKKIKKTKMNRKMNEKKMNFKEVKNKKWIMRHTNGDDLEKESERKRWMERKRNEKRGI